jgi:hypothetical protein
MEVTDVWARDTIGGKANAAVFMTIRSRDADRLVGASTPVAGKTDLMTMVTGNGAMSMKYVDGIDLPAGRPVTLDPAGLHVWLENLEEPLRAKRSFPLLLRFEKAGDRRVDVSVLPPTATGPGMDS